MQLPKISTSNNWTQVYRLLKTSILQRKFGPNGKIAIPELAAQLGVSPTPIRDALNRLEAEGLIRTVPKVGTFVAPLTGKHAKDMIENRLMMELWIADKWLFFDEETRKRAIDGMMELVRVAEQTLTPERAEEYRQSDYDLKFHLTWIRAGDNADLADMYEAAMNYRVFNLAADLVTPEMNLATWAQHRAIVEALAADDIGRVKAAIRAHLDSSRRNLLYFIESSGGYL